MIKNKPTTRISSGELTYSVLLCSYANWTNFGRHIANNVYHKNDITGDFETVEVTHIASYVQFRNIDGMENGEKYAGCVVTTAENIPILLKNITDFYSANPHIMDVFTDLCIYVPTMKVSGK